MESPSTETPDGGGFSMEEGGDTGLPSPLAAAVTASLQEGRETQATGGYQRGEGVGLDIAAGAGITQAQEAGGPGGAQGGLPLNSMVSVVMTGPERREGEQASLGGNQ